MTHHCPRSNWTGPESELRKGICPKCAEMTLYEDCSVRPMAITFTDGEGNHLELIVGSHIPRNQAEFWRHATQEDLARAGFEPNPCHGMTDVDAEGLDFSIMYCQSCGGDTRQGWCSRCNPPQAAVQVIPVDEIEKHFGGLFEAGDSYESVLAKAARELRALRAFEDQARNALENGRWEGPAITEGLLLLEAIDEARK